MTTRPSCWCEEAGHDTRTRCPSCPKNDQDPEPELEPEPEPALEQHVFEDEDKKPTDEQIVFDIQNR